MNYKRIYDSLINRAVDRNWSKSTAPCYIEIHHIIPKCVGGTNEKTNLVSLTPSEHFIAHQLLVKIYPSEHKLIYALNCLNRKSSNQIRCNKQYSWIKNRIYKHRSELWKTDVNPGKNKSKETKLKIAISGIGNTNKRGKKMTSEQRINNSNRQARTYYMINPIGEPITIVNMSLFCRENGLNKSHMCAVSSGKEKQYKGWQVQTIKMEI